MKLRVALFYHSLVSDWNHGNAHFLRGIAGELIARGDTVTVYEPKDGWSRSNLTAEQGVSALAKFARRFPDLRSVEYTLDDLDLDTVLDSCDIAIVHEWSDAKLIKAVGNYRRRNAHLRLFFHDTHHRAVTAFAELHRFDLQDYDGILAYGSSLKIAYERLGWNRCVHVWHEAADVRVFYPRSSSSNPDGDLVWIGNWGDEERTEELLRFFIEPARELGVRSTVYGVRYPQLALSTLEAAQIEYRGWIPNFEVPNVFSNFRVTLHIPRGPYTRQLPGIPTIRPFEALACGIPLISAPWSDTEGLFRVGQDFLMVPDGPAMKTALRDLLNDAALAESLARNGLETIRQRHTCGHRIDQLLTIYQAVASSRARQEILV